MDRTTVVAICGWAAIASTSAGERGRGLELWAVDPLIKVFRDTEPGPTTPAFAEVARGEHATLQLVARSLGGIQGLRVSCPNLALRAEPNLGLRPTHTRFAGYVFVDRPTPNASKDQLRDPPAGFPDPLLECESLDVNAGDAQPIWITVPVPKEAVPGMYSGVVDVTAKVHGKPVSACLPVTLRVYDVTIHRTRLWVTNWFVVPWPHMTIAPRIDSPAYWKLLRRYARNMAAHRQNVARISPLDLADFHIGEGGRLEADFSRVDRWVTIFMEEGVIGRIEGGHIGGRSGDWNSPFVVQTRSVENGAVQARRVAPQSAAANQFYSWFLPALVSHLREKGWLDVYMQHLADEPVDTNAESYKAMARLVRKYALELRIIEACQTTRVAGAVDVWVPQLDFFAHDHGFYRQRQRTGEEVWFYTCMFPQGEYANRFIEQPLLKTRILHWINLCYGATGYLHWGYNYWNGRDPFRHTTRGQGRGMLPAGDAWIVYPGRDGPLDSIRFEAMRDGIVDHELLSMLAERDTKAAADLARRHVLDFDRYELDVAKFRATRRKLLELLSRPASASRGAP